jgi:hypothetical protein
MDPTELVGETSTSRAPGSLPTSDRLAKWASMRSSSPRLLMIRGDPGACDGWRQSIGAESRLRTEELGEKEGTTGVWKDGEGIRGTAGVRAGEGEGGEGSSDGRPVELGL